MYYMGIDGGTSYSKLIGMDEEMKVVGRHMGNAISLTKLPLDTATTNLHRLVAEFFQMTRCDPADCAGICMGISGLDESPKVKGYAVTEAFEKTLADSGFKCPVHMVSVAEIILASNIRGGSGLLVDARSDSYAFAVDDIGDMYRCGGLGYHIDGGGGGYVMGMQAIKYAFMSSDGRIPTSILEKRVCEHFSAEHMEDVLPKLNPSTLNAAKISELAIVVKYAAEAGDAYARHIQEVAANELYLMARALTDRCTMEIISVTLSGPVLLLNDAIRNEFSRLYKADYPDAIVETVKEKPEVGAVYLAMKHAGALPGE